jgi:protein-S-isoprenylcysteine O-methyltransferase Ste14
MAYIDEMKLQGSWLFRKRSFFPLIIMSLLFPAGLLNSPYLMGSPSIDRLWQLACLAIAMFGLLIRMYTVGYVADGTSGRTTSEPKAKSLNTTGIYSIVRHPLYLSNFVIWAGIAMLPHSALLVVTCVFAFFLNYERIIITEEAFLADKFGDAFTQWAKKTPALIFKRELWVKPDRLFSWQAVFKREYPGVLTVTATFFAIHIFINWNREGNLQPDRLWLSLLGISMLIFITGWILRKAGITDRRRTPLAKPIPKA